MGRIDRTTGMNQTIENTGTTTRSRVERGGRAVRAAGRVVVLATAAAFAGCSDGSGSRPPVFPVKGSVTFEGAPAAGAFVAFHPKAVLKPGEEASRSSAQVRADGTFEVTTSSQADGAPAGEYAVTVLWTRPVKQGDDTVPGPNVIPTIYGDPATTPLKATIKDAPNQLEPFSITRK